MKETFSSSAFYPLSVVVNTIVPLVSPEKIFLVSVIHHEASPENIFVQHQLTEKSIGSFQLLVLAAEPDTRSCDELQDIIEHRSGCREDITALVMPVHLFNNWLMKNHPFATRIYYRAALVYDANNTPLAIPDEYSETVTQELLQKKLDRHIGQAIEFISGAELFIVRKQYALAVFNLHQAAEQLYSGAIRFITGFRVHTHNLDKLHRYTKHLLPGLSAIFPRSSGPEKDLFLCLQKAYTDGRYNDDFNVKHLMAFQLTERVQKLLELCKNLPYSIITT